MPDDATVTYGHLKLWLNSQSTTTQGNWVHAHRLTRQIAAGATWNSPWTTPGGDFASAVSCTNCPFVGGPAGGGGHQPGGPVYWNIPDLVAAWANGSVANDGVLLKVDQIRSDGNILSFSSSEAANPPHLAIRYQPRVGILRAQKYETQQLTDRLSLAVNSSNGNLLLRSRDLTVPGGLGPDLTIVRTYNSLRSEQYAYGRGFGADFGPDVRLETNHHDRIVYHGPSGFGALFKATGDTSYQTPKGFNAKLEKTSTGWTYTENASQRKLTFDSNGRLTRDQDINNHAIAYTYSGTGSQLAKITDSQGRDTTFTYTSGRITQMTDPAGRVYQYTYDSSGRLIRYVDPETGDTWIDWNTYGPVLITTPAGRKIKLVYHGAGAYQGRVASVIRVTNPNDPFASMTGPTTQFAYTISADGSGQSVVTDPNTNQVTTVFDTDGRPTATTDGAGNTISLTYGSAGDIASVKLPGGGVTNYGYDTDRRLTCVQRGVSVVQDCRDENNSSGLKTTLTYANTDELTKYFPTRIVNPQGNVVTYCYNGSEPACAGTTSGPPGSLKTVTNGLVTQSVWGYSYNASGTLASATDSRGNVTTYGYDSVGNLTSVTPPSQAFVPAGSARVGPTGITPDALGRPVTITDGKNQTANYTYDNLDRPTQIVYKTAGGTIDRTISHIYDNDGQLRTLTDPHGVTTYTVDELQRLTREAFVSNGTVLSYTHDYTYDAASNLKTLTDTGGTTTYTYDGLNQLSAMREPGDSTDTTFSYNSDGARTQIKYTSGVTVNWGYDIASGRTTSVVNKGPTGNVLKSYSYTYTHPTTGKDTELQQTVTDEAANRTVNTYDALERLTDAVTTAGPNPSRFNFVLDGNGNRTSETINLSGSTGGRTKTWEFDEVNLPCWRAYWSTSPTGGPYSCANRPAPELANVEAITHDANGNDIDNKHQAFTYNPTNQPTTVTVNTAQFRPPTQEALAYRGAGQSQLVKDGAATVQQNLLGIGARGTGTTYYPRAADGTLISQRTPTETARRNYLYDANGSIMELTNPSGELSTSYRYDAYGHPLNRYPTGDENPFGYAGTYMAGVATDGVLCGPFNIGPSGVPYDAEDGRFTQATLLSSVGLPLKPDLGGALDWVVSNRKKLGTIAVGGACLFGPAACGAAAVYYMVFATADSTIRVATEPGFGASDWVRAMAGDSVSTLLMTMPMTALGRVAGEGVVPAAKLLPTSRVGRLAVKTSLVAPGVTTGLVWR